MNDGAPLSSRDAAAAAEPGIGQGTMASPLVAAVRDAWVARLRAFVMEAPRQPACELCSAPCGEAHPHLFDVRDDALMCCCRPCALLFGHPSSTRYRRVPERVVALRDLHLTDTQWATLGVPVDIAFFFASTREGRVVACYPGPAGTLRARPEAGAWEALAAAHPSLRDLAPDVEALLVNRIDGARECFRVPIDQCYALTGLLRQRWHGLAGGAPAHEALAAFLDALRREEPAASAIGHA